MLIDVHQHVWTEPLLDALERRSSLPFIRRQNGLVTLHLADEPSCLLDLPHDDPATRAGMVASDGVDRALVCISSPLGIEALPRGEADVLLDAYHAGALALGPKFGVWGAIALESPDPDDVEQLRARGCVGWSLPAGALGEPQRAQQVLPALARAQELNFPVFVHPGPGPLAYAGTSSLSQPTWWPALTRYVADMSAAWVTFVTALRRELPDLQVVFAMLAGGAPLLAERLEVRSGLPCTPADDPRLFYDTSSFGPAAIEVITRLVDEHQLVYGSDRPVIEPPPGTWHLQFAGNAQSIFEPVEVAA